MNTFLPPGARLVIPNSGTGTRLFYTDVEHPDVRYYIENAADYPLRAQSMPLPSTQLPPFRADDGSLWVVGVLGNVDYITHIRPGHEPRALLGNTDRGRGSQPNIRARWRMKSGQLIEINPTFLGGTAGTSTIYPSPGIRRYVSQEATWVAVTARCRTPLDFDTRNRENGWGLPMVDPSDTRTQVVWLTMPMESRRELALDGVWDCVDYARHLEGTPESVESVEMDAGLVVSHFLPGADFEGGADLVDGLSGATVEIRGSRWATGEKPIWNAVYQHRPSTGQPGRVDYSPGEGTDATLEHWGWPFPSGHAIVILHSGADGVPDGKSSVGFYVRLYPQSATEAETRPNAIKIGALRKGQFSTPAKLTDWRTVKVTIACESAKGVRRPAGSEVWISHHWTHGAHEEVLAKLRRKATGAGA